MVLPPAPKSESSSPAPTRSCFAVRRARDPMTNPVTIAAIFLGPLLVILIVFLASQVERQRRAAAPEPGFFQRNGAPVAIFLLVAVGFWALFLIVFPQLYMIDYSFHPNLPQIKRGGPEDAYTLENYRYFLFGS